MVLGQTITIVNKSGKIVSTSKHLVNVFNEAKSAYNERKAELKALRKSEQDVKESRRRLEVLTIASEDDISETHSRRSSRRGSEDGRSTRRKPVPGRSEDRPPVERGVSDSFYTNDLSFDRPRRASHRPSPLRHDSGLIYDTEPRAGELTRRNTDGMQLQRQRPHTPTRSASADDIDMDLAYGELPPPLPERKYNDEVELRSKMSSLQSMLDEFNCLQHTVTSVVDKLQKNPDALAAVALTLAEISNLATKMAPGALMSMKTSFPAIVALLASPEFAIAAGVGVGVTIIALGGYKIIKKIKARNEANRLLENGAEGIADQPETPVSEYDELREIDRIEVWRRGITAAEAETVGSSVDGEFITPVATNTLIKEGRLRETDLVPAASTREGKKHRSSKKKSTKSETSSKSHKHRSGSSSSKTKAKKEPSGLRMLFKGSSA